MLVIPLQSVPAQQLAVSLADQPCRITVRQRAFGLYIDLSIDDAPIISGVKAIDRTRIVRDTYLGFLGDLAIADLQGLSDPDYAGLGSRFILCYFADGELPFSP